MRGTPSYRQRLAFWLGCLVVGLLGGIVVSCVVADPQYCAIRSDCPYAETELGSMQQLLCDPTRHSCVQSFQGICFMDEDCKDFLKPRCDVTTNSCTSCRVADQTDRSCTHFKERPLCSNASDGSGATLCVACQNHLDCPADSPICDNQLCRKCSAHSDCEGAMLCDNGAPCTDPLVCIGAGDLPGDTRVGSCAQNKSAASGRVVYVNPLDPSCNKANSGTEISKPVCVLDTAFDIATAPGQSRRYIRVFGSVDRLNNRSIITGFSLSFIGAPRKNSTGMATVSSRSTAFNIAGGSLTIDQLHISEASHPDANLIQCSGSAGLTDLPSLTLRRSVLTGSTMAAESTVSNVAAVSVSNCNVIIDGNVIGVQTQTEATDPLAMAHGQGISISDQPGSSGTYLIQNNLIVGNAGVALNFLGVGSTNPKIVARFNTIVANGRNPTNMYGAVACPMFGGPLQEFSHSIVDKNRTFSGGSQFFNPSLCNIKDIVVGTTAMETGPAFIVKDPNLDATFRINAMSDCCIDAVSPGAAETLPSQDIDGISRPQGSKWDIGASELKK